MTKFFITCCLLEYKGRNKIKKHLKTVKTSIVLGILFFSLIVTFTPSSTAVPFSAGINVKMTYDATVASAKVVPLTGEIAININISAKIEGLLAKLFERIFQGRNDLAVDLTVKETPSWCTARISPNVVNPRLSAQWESEEAYVHISFNEDAPANVPAIITIEMQASAPGTFERVKGVTKTTTISFTPAYLPIIDATPHNNYQETKPGKIVTFDIDLENLGNAETEFIFNVREIPEGWTASVPSNITIGSRLQGENPKNTVQFSVTPPETIESQKIREVINLTVRGQYFASPETESKTDEYIMSFTVEVEDASTPGFEPIVFILSIVIIALIIIIIIMALIIKKQHSS